MLYIILVLIKHMNFAQHYKNNDIRLIHIVKDDYYIQKVQKPISAMVEGPKIDSYILERM